MLPAKQKRCMLPKTRGVKNALRQRQRRSGLRREIFGCVLIGRPALGWLAKQTDPLVRLGNQLATEDRSQVLLLSVATLRGFVLALMPCHDGQSFHHHGVDQTSHDAGKVYNFDEIVWTAVGPPKQSDEK